MAASTFANSFSFFSSVMNVFAMCRARPALRRTDEINRIRAGEGSKTWLDFRRLHLEHEGTRFSRPEKSKSAGRGISADYLLTCFIKSHSVKRNQVVDLNVFKYDFLGAPRAATIPSFPESEAFRAR
jgi:hypothetical protein